MLQTGAAPEKLWMFRLLIAATVVIAFGYSIGAPFVGWDDQELIVGNPNFNPPTMHGLARIWRQADHEMYIPVVYSAWWGLAHFGMNAHVFHAANVIAQMLGALVVFQILLLLVESSWAACAGAILFAVHPLQTEAVAWATGMKDCLSGLLALLAIWQYVRARQADSLVRYAIASVAFVLALLAKPSTVCVPVICLVLDLLIFRRRWIAVIWQIGLWLIFAIVVTWIAAKAQPVAPTVAVPSLLSRPLVAADSVCWYLWKLVLPLGLALDYSRTPGSVLQAGWAAYEAAGLLLFAIAVTMLRKPRIAAGALVFLVALAPVSGVTPFAFQRYSTVADRYAYLALLGAAIVLASVLRTFAVRRWRPALAVVLAALTFLSIRQTFFWHDTRTLFEHTLEVNPTSLAATRSLGFYWAQQHDDAQAAAYYQRAARAHPEDPLNHFNYANLLRRHRLLDAAIEQYQRAIQGEPANPQYELNYGVALAMADRNEEALNALEAATKLDPADADAWQDLGLVLEKLDRVDEARRAFAKSIQLDPSRTVPRQHLRALTTRP